MTVLYIVAGLLLLTALLYLLAIMPSLRRHPAVKRCMYRSYAHRGLYDNDAGIPENSIDAFRRAADAGFGMELDVHLTADGQLMVMHDENIKRMTGEDLNIFEQTSERLERCRLLGTEHTIPYLSQVLETVAGRVPLLIELKSNGRRRAELCSKVCELLDGYDGAYLLESFDPRVLLWLRRNRPELPRGQLSIFYNRHGDHLPPLLDFSLRNYLTNFATKPDFLAMYHEDKDCFSVKMCRRLFHVPEFDWTVRTPEQQRESEALGNVVIFEHYIPERRN